MIARRGMVYLVGAGPGDPELMTLRGQRLVKEADTIIHDRLIPFEVLSWARTKATKIDVGKYPDHHRISQSEINRLLVLHAQRGETVVRLKGGDPFVFGRGQEEFEACQNAGVPCVVVPGISSAIAGPAAAGVPVTTRGIARSMAMITAQTDPRLIHNQLDFDALAKLDTIVVLMGRKNLRHVTESLIERGREPRTPVTCIENATMPHQQVTAGTLATIADQVDQLGFGSPMITVIGDVAALVNPDLVQLPENCDEVMHFYAYEFGE
jgi:uroporphyrin-III C-methyltransferase